MKSRLLLLVSAVASIAASACQSGGVGDPCVPEGEYDQNNSGYDVAQVYTESGSFQCESRLCLVNHFAGRVSCPYGQPGTTDATNPVDKNKVPGSVSQDDRCYVPGSRADGNPQNLINVPVPAQLQARPPTQAVYCSCRCDGPDKGIRYCQCPSGYSCTELIEPGLVTTLGSSGGGQLAGSYCIKAGTAVDNASALPTGTCDHAPGACGPKHPDGI